MKRFRRAAILAALVWLPTQTANSAFPLAHLDQSSITPSTFSPYFQYQGWGHLTDAFSNQWSKEAQSFTVGKAGDWYGFTIAGEGPHHPPNNNVVAPDHTIAWEIWNVNNAGNLTTPVSGQSGTFTIHNWDIETTFDISLNGTGIAVIPGDRYAISMEDLTTTPSYGTFGPVGSAVWYFGDWSSQASYGGGQALRFDPNANSYSPMNSNGPVDLLFETYVTPEPSSAALGLFAIVAMRLYVAPTRRRRHT